VSGGVAYCCECGECPAALSLKLKDRDGTKPYCVECARPLVRKSHVLAVGAVPATDEWAAPNEQEGEGGDAQ
jgi:NAD-dependent SIR2 family protein deacetylase